MIDTDSKEKAKLIKEALTIVDELSTYIYEDQDDYLHCYDEIRELVKRSEKLKKNRLWKL